MTWVSAEISDVAQVFNGKTPSKSDQRMAGHPVLKIRDVDDTGVFRGKFGSFVEYSYAAIHKTKNVAAGDTLILNAAHNASYVASKVFYCRESAIGALATGEWTVVRPNTEVVDPCFLHYWITSEVASASLADMVKGIHLYPRDVSRLSLPLPPLAEQKRIAAILDQADALRRARRRALDRLNTLGQAIFQEMFVAGPGDWPSVKIEMVTSDARTGPFGSQLLHSEFVDAGIPVLGIDNVVSNQFVWAQPRFITAEKYRGLRRYTVSPGDVLITIMGTCGRCVIVPDDIPKAINTKHICCLTPDRSRVTSEYLRAAFLMHPEVLRQLGVEAKGAVMPGLNMGIIKKTEIPLPPLDLQLRFGERIGRIHRQDSDLRQQAASLDSLFASLQHRAFTGQL